MTLSVADVRQRLAGRFTDIEEVDESVIRFTRRGGDRPFAVYYLDMAGELPATQEALTKYQDHVIGRHYFDGKKSLQWNNYLYFITSAESLGSIEVRQAKELIEQDRSYARKMVIAEEELESVLTPGVIAPTGATPREGILALWTERLTEAGLDTAILSDDDLPAKLRLIEASSGTRTSSDRSPKRTPVVQPAGFIRSLQLKRYREFPHQRDFEFRSVNLICGPNGSGKTSVLEAIELLYCGRNKRNPGAWQTYELAAVLADGRSEVATEGRDLQLFRDRNLVWYGQPEVKSHNLHISFGQFNFLDTDAAVSLSTDRDVTERIEDDLARLLVGADAAKTWREVERVGEAISSRLRELRPLEEQASEELRELAMRTRAADSVPQASDSIHTRLVEIMRRLEWSSPEREKEALAAKLVEDLSELLPVTQQAVGLEWAESPVSLHRLSDYVHNTKSAITKAESAIGHLERLGATQKRLVDEVSRHREALDSSSEIRRLIDAGVSSRVAERRKLTEDVATYAGLLAGVDAHISDRLAGVDLESTVRACEEAAVARSAAAKQRLTQAGSEYANFAKLRDQSLALAQELRQIAGRILQSSPRPDECPLCHTQFGPGGLVDHMRAGVDEHLESAGQTLLDEVQHAETAVRQATAGESALDGLREFSRRARLPADLTVGAALAKLEATEQAATDARARVETLNAELRVLESQALSPTRLEEVATRLGELGYPLADRSREETARLISIIDENLKASVRKLESENQQADALRVTLQEALHSGGSIQDLRGAISRTKERLTVVESLRAKLDVFASSCPWPAGRPLAELAVEAQSLQEVAAELQAALNRERLARETHTEANRRRGNLEKQLAELRPRIKRLSEAQSVLGLLQEQHSLTGAMDAALLQNRVGIEEIFSQIHAPAEFSGLGSRLTTLIRKTDGNEVKLSEISSGQRAAFALSIFLAQNAQLTAAPPIVLIDDPIAHVDDLNSLSFFDYLREVALIGRRQIFFATASDKLATLFERKFDFLGPEGFRKFELRRDTGPGRSEEGVLVNAP